MKKYARSLLLIAAILALTTVGVVAQSFNNPVPIPYTISDNTQNMVVQNSSHNFDPMGTVDSVQWVIPDGTGTQIIKVACDLNQSLPSYCYNQTGNSNMSYLGPTLVWQQGDWFDFNIENQLVTDTVTHNDSTTVHWHGLNVVSAWDGGPHQAFDGDSTWKPGFPIIDSVQTLWYHSHLGGLTTEQVIMGLAGLIIVQDPAGDPYYATLPHDYGKNDFPIIIQEKAFNWNSTDTSTQPWNAISMVTNERPGNGDFTLINGVVNGVLKVPAEVIRFRVLNGSPRKSFQMAVSTTLSNPTSFETLYQIASDGDYMGQPGTGALYSLDSFMVSPGERNELIVDLTGFANGDTLYLSNLVPTGSDIVTSGKANAGFPAPGTPGDAFMAIVIDNSVVPSAPITSLPASLKPYALLDTSNIFKHRKKELQRTGQGGSWLIDGTPMDMGVLNDTLLVNTMEEWTINNATPVAHPFHIHKTQFQIVRYKGKEGSGDNTIDASYPNLPEYMMGFKDVILVRAGAEVSFVARFDSFPDPTIKAMDGYMYHCHILIHEDSSMMHQFTVVDSAAYFAATDIDEVLTGPGQIKVYPNPADDVLQLRSTYRTSGTLRIYDLLGRTFYEQEFAPFEGVKQIDVQHLPRGIMLVEWTSEEQRVVEKVLLH